MSSAILYLAIVAIWAGFLVPAWIRRPHGSRSGSATETEFTAEFDADTEIEVESGAQADLEGGVHVEVSRHVQVSRHSEAVRQASADRRGGEYVDDTPGYPEMDERADSRAPAAGPSQSREQMLRARRRMLTIMVSLTLLAWGLAATGLAAWWLCVPPTGMLVLYVLLLREIADAEAEMASKRSQAHAARVARQRAREAWAASQPEPTAQIIDISDRVGDQLYDQYADAAVRAVGD